MLEIGLVKLMRSIVSIRLSRLKIRQEVGNVELAIAQVGIGIDARECHKISSRKLLGHSLSEVEQRDSKRAERKTVISSHKTLEEHYQPWEKYNTSSSMLGYTGGQTDDEEKILHGCLQLSNQ